MDFELNRPPTLPYASGNTPPVPNFLPRQLSHAGILTDVVNDRPRATLPYDQWAYDTSRRSLALLPLDLLQPANAIVMVMIFVGFLIAEFTAFLAVGGAFPLGVVSLIIILLSVSHYVNVIDETGPEARDEMPPPLRDVSLWDDLLKPVILLVVALAVCFGPAALIWHVGGWQMNGAIVALVAAVALVGAYIFPAVMLTLVAGGTIMNLMPWRLLRVIAVGGRNYAIAAGILLPLMVGLHVAAGVVLSELIVGAFGWTIMSLTTAPSPLVLGVVGHLLLLAAVFSAHLFSWWMGRLYQRGHARYGWLLQRHERFEEKAGDASTVHDRESQSAARSKALEAQTKHASARVRSRLPV